MLSSSDVACLASLLSQSYAATMLAQHQQSAPATLFLLLPCVGPTEQDGRGSDLSASSLTARIDTRSRVSGSSSSLPFWNQPPPFLALSFPLSVGRSATEGQTNLGTLANAR